MEFPAKRCRQTHTTATSAIQTAFYSSRASTHKQLENARARDQQRHQELTELQRQSIAATQGVGQSLERLAENFERLAQALQVQPQQTDANQLNQAIAATLLQVVKK